MNLFEINKDYEFYANYQRPEPKILIQEKQNTNQLLLTNLIKIITSNISRIPNNINQLMIAKHLIADIPEIKLSKNQETSLRELPKTRYEIIPNRLIKESFDTISLLSANNILQAIKKDINNKPIIKVKYDNRLDNFYLLLKNNLSQPELNPNYNDYMKLLKLRNEAMKYNPINIPYFSSDEFAIEKFKEYKKEALTYIKNIISPEINFKLLYKLYELVKQNIPDINLKTKDAELTEQIIKLMIREEIDNLIQPITTEMKNTLINTLTMLDINYNKSIKNIAKELEDKALIKINNLFNKKYILI